ncbi:MAG TPA: amidase [Gaiellales bacterium]|jgi:aspartyl-tRNA(Asn)/glutamyl-tRNA(Gln) amidotransferase subunit A|nr:amidase [Gaiellales bacterium]
MAALHTWSARRIAAAVRARELSAEEVTRHHLDRIAEHEHLHAVITVSGADALARAREPPLGPLAGVPFLVKDIFDTAGVRTTYGSGIFREHVPVRSATSVCRLLDAGAIMLGKANLHEFAWGVTSRNRAYGAVVNSARPDRIPGGSSGGNASALAAGLCALGLATDTGASIRLPAAACGVAGFKPAFGSVPADGLWPLAPSFDHVGPLARSLDDCALAFDVLRGAPLAPADAAALAVRRLEPAELAATTEAFLEGAGLPPAPDLVRLHLAECAEVHREIYAEHRDAYDDDLHAKIAVGFAVAREERASLVSGLHAWRKACAARCPWDVLVTPAYPGDLPPFDVPATIELTDRMTAYTRPVNWLGWPSAVTADGSMHTGLDEAAVLAHALAWEAVST